jgi:hypothetical protein
MPLQYLCRYRTQFFGEKDSLFLQKNCNKTGVKHIPHILYANCNNNLQLQTRFTLQTFFCWSEDGFLTISQIYLPFSFSLFCSSLNRHLHVSKKKKTFFRLDSFHNHPFSQYLVYSRTVCFHSYFWSFLLLNRDFYLLDFFYCQLLSLYFVSFSVSLNLTFSSPLSSFPPI